MEYATFLRHHIEHIVPLSDEEFELVCQFFVPLSVQKKEQLIRVGQRVLSEYLVIDGCLKTSAYDVKGKEYIIQFALGNWWVSDYPAYVKGGNAELNVVALEKSCVLEISAQNRKIMCERVPKMYAFHGQKSLAGYAAGQQRILSLLRNSAKEKYDLLLSLYPELFQRLTKKTIAHYLGVSRETLSRLEKGAKKKL